MGLLDKLKFWKKEEPAGFELGKYPALERGPAAEMPDMAMPPSEGLTEMPSMEEVRLAPPAPFSEMGRQAAPAPSAFAPAMPAPSAALDMTREMQVVNAKLDTLKALLDGINAKLDRLERAQMPKEEEPISLSVRRWR
ncbi:MAG: hypothetical protein QXR48_03850 [Candidatus Woesearchaeota archaeon]